jgi:hypothetical protein
MSEEEKVVARVTTMPERTVEEIEHNSCYTMQNTNTTNVMEESSVEDSDEENAIVGKKSDPNERNEIENGNETDDIEDVQYITTVEYIMDSDESDEEAKFAAEKEKKSQSCSNATL